MNGCVFLPSKRSFGPRRLFPRARCSLEQANTASVADAQGRVTGGHVGAGCIVRTTAELLLAPLPDWQFARRADAETGWAELVIEPAPRH